MKNYTKQDILRLIEEEDVEFIRLQFTDMLGMFKNVAVTSSQMEKALNNNCMFNGSSVDGFLRIEETDLYLYPDLNTFEIFPWRPQQGKVARLICDMYRQDRTPFESDPRYVLKREMEKAHQLGYEFHVGPECEFFLCHMDDEGNPTMQPYESASYLDVGPLDQGENARRDIVLTLEEMGFEVESSFHAVAPAQHEIDFKYDSAVQTADNLMTFKLAVRTIARRHGLHAAFMPKPKTGMWGSGMHLHMSMEQDGHNVFYDGADELHLSRLAYYFMGGLMKHIKAITAITNPLINSYKRLIAGYEAPVYIAWSSINKGPLIRIPVASEAHTRLELRSPDPSANPYLAMAVCLAAGLDGIENKIMPPHSVAQDIYQMTEEERLAAGIESLPRDLREAIHELEQDSLICEVLGEKLADAYIRTKKAEWKDYTAQVTPWEEEQYLYRI